MANNKNAKVPKTFGKQLVAFAEFAKQYQAATPGFDAAELAADAEAQGVEEQQDLDRVRQTATLHEQFAQNQSARYRRFMKALKMARARFADQPDVLKALQQFKHPKGRKSESQPTPSPKDRKAA